MGSGWLRPAFAALGGSQGTQGGQGQGILYGGPGTAGRRGTRPSAPHGPRPGARPGNNPLGSTATGMGTTPRGRPGFGGDLNGLTELAVKLRACDTPGALAGADLDALWNEAIRVLTEFSRPRAGDPGAEDRHFFWKRPR